MADTEKKVLIVDDEELTVRMLEEAVGGKGYAIRTALNGEDALSIVKEWHPDVILLDLVMPGLEGMKVVEAIRSMELSVRPSIIVISCKGEKDVMVEAFNKGADDYMVKPVNELELMARIRAQARIVDLCEALEEDRENLSTILDITSAIGATLDTSTVLDVIVQRVAETIGAVRCSIVLVAKGNDGYVLVSHDNPDVKNFRIDLRKYPEIREALKTREPVAINDILNHPLMAEVHPLIEDLKDMSVLVVPIIFSEEVLGTLFLRARRVREGFTKEEIDFCHIVANTSYNAIRNARIFERTIREQELLKEIAITDHLTTLYNQHFFYTRLEEEFERAVRYDNQLAVLMMDIDNFKSINDQYGHRNGDMVLKEIAAIIKKCVRKSDIVARYGGEEFAVILPHTPIEGAAGEAERIRKIIGEHCYAHLIKEEITMSFGVAAYPRLGLMNSGDLVNASDKALYAAKAAGKNCVRVDGQEKK